MQVTSITYDSDTSVLDLRLVDGSEYRITNPAHAARVRSSVSTGGLLTDDQRFWLEQYRVRPSLASRDAIRARLAKLRRELKGKK
jgi:hypothetical protein